MKNAVSTASAAILVSLLCLVNVSSGARAQTHSTTTGPIGAASAVQISWPALPQDIVNLSGGFSASPSAAQQILQVPTDRNFILRNFDLVDLYNLCDCYGAPSGFLLEELPDGTQVTKHSFVIGHNSSYGSTVGIVFSPGSKVLFQITSGSTLSSIVRWNVTGFLAKL